MRRYGDELVSGQPKPGVLVMWGSAAWAQTQLTPGVSALAAPRSSYGLAPTGSALAAAARSETAQPPRWLQSQWSKGTKLFLVRSSKNLYCAITIASCIS